MTTIEAGMIIAAGGFTGFVIGVIGEWWKGRRK